MYKIIFLLTILLSNVFSNNKPLFYQANDILKKNQINEAIRLYHELLKEDKNASVYFNLSIAYLEKYKTSDDISFFIEAYKNGINAYFLNSNHQQIRSNLNYIEDFQKNSIDIMSSYPVSKLLFIKYFTTILSFFIFILSLLYFFYFKKNVISIKTFFLGHILLLLLLSLSYYNKNEFMNYFKYILIIEKKIDDNSKQYQQGDSFLPISKNTQQFAINVRGQTIWVSKKDMFIIDVAKFLNYEHSSLRTLYDLFE